MLHLKEVRARCANLPLAVSISVGYRVVRSGRITEDILDKLLIQRCALNKHDTVPSFRYILNFEERRDTHTKYDSAPSVEIEREDVLQYTLRPFCEAFHLLLSQANV